MFILHFTEKQIWEKESAHNTYGETTITAHGFIPCFSISDIQKIDFGFSTLKDYIILCIDTSKLSNEIKFEKFSDTDFNEPNIYGAIDTKAVVLVAPYTFDENDKFVLSPALLNFELLGKACEALKVSYENHQVFNDGTSSTILLLNNQYVIKKSVSALLKANATFAEFYQSVPMLQKLVYKDDEYQFVIFDYIPGDIMHTVIDFENLVSNLKKITIQFKSYPMDGYGYIHAPVDTWEEFLQQEVNHAKEMFPDADYLLPEVEEAVSILAKSQFDKKLIHGDFGAHNFIAVDDKFVAAIDPIPVVGDVLYDLLYALVSNIDLLPFLSMNYLTSYTGESKEKVMAMLKVTLYCRVCRNAIYDKDWIDPYLEFWDRFFKKEKRG